MRLSTQIIESSHEISSRPKLSQGTSYNPIFNSPHHMESQFSRSFRNQSFKNLDFLKVTNFHQSKIHLRISTKTFTNPIRDKLSQYQAIP